MAVINPMAMPWKSRVASSRRHYSRCVIQRESGEEWPEEYSHDLSRPRTTPHIRPRPGRRRYLQPTILTVSQLSFCFLILLSIFCVSASATRSANGRRQERYGKLASELPGWELIEPDLASFGPGEIVYDRRYPVLPVHHELHRRQDGVGIEESSSGTAKTTSDRRLKFSSTSTAKPAAATLTSVIPPDSSSSPSSSSSSSTSSPTVPTSIVTAPGADSRLPRPFDTGLGNNYTQDSCPQFMNNFLRNESFTSCLPFSLLLQVACLLPLLRSNLANRFLQNSMSFFSVTKSFSTITRTLDAACRPIDATCNPLMMSIASQLRQDENCAADYRREQPLVVAAYNGLVAYEALYKAGCARDAGTGNYCFANAITNTSSPTDNYPYYLPLGIPLPGGSQPSCTTCLKKTMQIFNEAASAKNQQALIRTLPAAAQMINVGCGPGFANGTIPSAGQNAGAVSAAIPRWSTVILLALSFTTMTGVI